MGKTAVVRQEMVRIIKYGMIMGEMWWGEYRFEQLEKLYHSPRWGDTWSSEIPRDARKWVHKDQGHRTQPWSHGWFHSCPLFLILT